ncbi:MAG: glycosyltransferase family 2 protein [Bacteroidales bacterium]|jgi:glycosyltransferase involved in cell wall biosynthesis|nr:glycosyltransferase family 2 protein [Bacteroidales bacterium]
MDIKVVILMTTYNGMNYLVQQIDSIIQQDYTNWLLYISDDKSTDNTMTILRRYQYRYANKIFILDNASAFSNPKDNFLNLLLRVGGELFMFCDQDDVWRHDKISISVEVYNKLSDEEKKKPILIHSDLNVVNEKLKTIKKSFFKYSYINPKRNKLKNLIVQNTVTGCTVLINRMVVDNIVPHLSKNEYVFSDIIIHDWLCALVASSFGQIICIDDQLVMYRQHSRNSIGARDAWSYKYVFSLLKNNRIKKSILDTERQAAAFLHIYGDRLELNVRKTIKLYSILESYPKYYRMYFIIKNGLLKYGIVRKIVQLIVI